MKKLLLLIVILLTGCSKQVVYDECTGVRRLINLDEFSTHEITFHNVSFLEDGDEYVFTYGSEPEMTKRYEKNGVFFYCFNEKDEVYGGELTTFTESIDVSLVSDFDVEYEVSNSVQLNTELTLEQTFTVEGERSLYVNKDLVSYSVQPAYDSLYIMTLGLGTVSGYSIEEFNGEHTYSLPIYFDEDEYEVGLYTVSIELIFFEGGIKYADGQNFLIEVYK